MPPYRTIPSPEEPKVKTAETGKLGLTVIFQYKIPLKKGNFIYLV